MREVFDLPFICSQHLYRVGFKQLSTILLALANKLKMFVRIHVPGVLIYSARHDDQAAWIHIASYEKTSVIPCTHLFGLMFSCFHCLVAWESHHRSTCSWTFCSACRTRARGGSKLQFTLYIRNKYDALSNHTKRLIQTKQEVAESTQVWLWPCWYL